MNSKGSYLYKQLISKLSVKDDIAKSILMETEYIPLFIVFSIVLIIFLMALWIIYRRQQQNRLQQEVSSILFEYSPVSSVEMEAVLNSNLKETLVV